MSKIELFKKVKKLLRNRQCNDALSVIKNYIETEPESQGVHRLLARVYIFNGEPEKAAHILETLLQRTRNNINTDNINNISDVNVSTSTAIVYVKQQAESLEEKEYTPEKEDISHIDEGQNLPDRDDGKSHLDKSCDVTTCIEDTGHEHVLLIKDALQLSAESKPDSSLVGNKILSNEESIDDRIAEENFQKDINEESLVVDSFSTDDFEEYDDSAEIVLAAHMSYEEGSEEEQWDNSNVSIYVLNDFDADDNRAKHINVQTDGGIDRETRAEQVAVEVIEKFGWGREHLSILKEIFHLKGWGQARSAVEREIKNGMLPAELYLAWEIRCFWQDNEQFSTTFGYIRNDFSLQQAKDMYQSMSWPAVLIILRSFHSVPDIDEIKNLIDDSYQYWFSSHDLRDSHPAFYEFLIACCEGRCELPEGRF